MTKVAAGVLDGHIHEGYGFLACSGLQAPGPWIQLHVVPDPNQPRLSELLTLSYRQRTLLLIV